MNIPEGFFKPIDKLILKFIWKGKWVRIDKTVLKKKKKLEESHYLILTLNYKATVIKTVWYWQRTRHKGQWNRIESVEIDACKYGQLIFDNGAVFLTNDAKTI